MIVIGPESSGTRLLTRLFIEAGCDGVATAEGRPEYEGWPQYYDANDPAGESPIVIQRTVPYHPGRVMPDLDRLWDRLEACGYRIAVAWITRSQDIAAKSQVAHGYAGDYDAAMKELESAHYYITNWLAKPDKKAIGFVLYETLVRDPLVTFNEILEAIGIAPLEKIDETIYNGNSKYMEA